jgi:hypothetical protein
MKAVVSVSDLHVGSLTGLCSPDTRMDEGGGVILNKFQETLWRFWRHFWDEWVPVETAGAETVAIEFNGDLMDGDHHNNVALWTNDTETQVAATVEILKPIATRYEHKFVVRGTPAHGGASSKAEETVAREIGADQDAQGNFSTWQQWLKMDNVVFQFAHHIGVTSSTAYETSAPMRELIAALVEAAEWGYPLPNVMVRSHRHRFVPVSIPSFYGRIQCIITPGWQLKTPFVERIDRMRMPHIGGVIFKVEGDECQVREKLYPLPGPEPVTI